MKSIKKMIKRHQKSQVEYLYLKSKFKKYESRIEYYDNNNGSIYIKLHNITCELLTILSIVLSLVVLVCEISIPFQHKLNFSIYFDTE